MLEIRFATPEDAPVLLALIRELAEYERLAHEVKATEDGLRAQLSGPRPAAEALMALVDGQPAGMAIFFHNFSTFLARPGLYLEDLFVRPAHRRAGIGKAMLQRLAQIAQERGCGRFEWTVLDWNQSAINFYQAMGAQVLPDWRICRVVLQN